MVASSIYPRVRVMAKAEIGVGKGVTVCWFMKTLCVENLSTILFLPCIEYKTIFLVIVIQYSVTVFYLPYVSETPSNIRGTT